MNKRLVAGLAAAGHGHRERDDRPDARALGAVPRPVGNRPGHDGRAHGPRLGRLTGIRPAGHSGAPVSGRNRGPMRDR